MNTGTKDSARAPARLTAFRGKDKISQQEIDDALEAKALKSATDKPKRRIGFNNEN